MKSRIFSSKYIKAASRGREWIPAFLTLGYLLAFPVASLLMTGNWKSAEYTPWQMSVLYENLWKDGFLISGGIVTILAAFLNSVNGFLYLYSGKKTDFYHSLPVKRSRLFWSRVYIGFLYHLIPYAAMEFLAVCIGAARGFFSLKLMRMALVLLLIHLLLYFMVYFSIVFVFCITGNILMGTFCLAAVYGYGPVLGLVLAGYRTIFYSTYSVEYSYGLLHFLKTAASPASLAVSFYQKYSKGEENRYFLMILLVTAVFAAASYLAYVRRASEAAERPMVYGKAEVLLKFLIVIPAGLFVGSVFYLIPSNGTRIVWWIFGLILGTILAHGLMESVYEMDFHCFFRRKLQLLLSVALVAVSAAAYQIDVFRFDSYLPKQDKLEAISLDLGTLLGDGGGLLSVYFDGSYDIDYNGDKRKLTSRSGQGIGDKTYQTLQEMIKKQKDRGKVYQDSSEFDPQLITTGIQYNLKSGRGVYRKYSITPDESKALLSSLYEETNLKELHTDFLELDGKYLSEVYLYGADGNSYMIFQNQTEKQLQLIEALKKDIREAKTEELLEAPCCSVQLSYQLPGRIHAERMIPGKENRELGAYFTCNIFPSYENARKLLEETGYPLTAEQLTTEKIMLTYYVDGTEGKTIEYKDPQEMDAIKAAAVPLIGNCSWLNYSYDINADFSTEKGIIYMQLLTDKLPDFVWKELEQLEDKEEAVRIGGVDGPTAVYIKEKDEDIHE